MKKLTILALASVISTIATSQNSTEVNYDQYFTNQTMRVDYFHSGTSTEEHFSVDRILNDGVWAGSRTILKDDLNLGLYFLKFRILYRISSFIAVDLQVFSENGKALVMRLENIP